MRAKAYPSELIELMKKALEGLIPRTPIARPMSLWRPPRNGFIKINSDASFIAQFGHLFGGVIMRNNMGKMVAGITFISLTAWV